jgi:hypothetical protein
MKVFINPSEVGEFQVYVMSKNALVTQREVHSNYEDALTAAKYLSVENRALICDCS